MNPWMIGLLIVVAAAILGAETGGLVVWFNTEVLAQLREALEGFTSH